MKYFYESVITELIRLNLAYRKALKIGDLRIMSYAKNRIKSLEKSIK